MTDKRRLNRVRWTQNPSAEGVEPVESSPTPWATSPAAEDASAWGAASMPVEAASWTTNTGTNSFAHWRNVAEQGAGQHTTDSVDSSFLPQPSLPAEEQSASWQMAAADEAPASWAETGDYAQEYNEIYQDEDGSEQDYAAGVYDPETGEFYEEGFYDEEEEAAYLEQQRLITEAERRTLRDALLILVALYIICGIAPLFMGLFVPLKVFFWLEIGGWAIIIAWLIIGVRRPLMHWFRERARLRAEQEQEQVTGEQA